MAIDNFSVASSEYGNSETELSKAAAHPIDGRIVPAGISGVGDEPIDRPELNLERLSDSHAHLAQQIAWRVSS